MLEEQDPEPPEYKEIGKDPKVPESLYFFSFYQVVVEVADRVHGCSHH